MTRMGTDGTDDADDTDGTDDADGTDDTDGHGWSNGFMDGATDARRRGYSSMPAKVSPWLGSPVSKPFLNQYILCLEVPCVNASGTT